MKEYGNLFASNDKKDEDAIDTSIDIFNGIEENATSTQPITTNEKKSRNLYNQLNDNSKMIYDKLYENKENFNEFHNHQEFLARVKDECIKRNNKNAVIVHHNEKYNGKIPIWVLVSFFSIGTLSRFFGNMKTSDKKTIAKNLYATKLKLLESWLKCLTVLRNKCAHYSRLYFLKFSNYPKLPKDSDLKTNSRLFGQMLVLNLWNLCLKNIENI